MYELQLNRARSGSFQKRVWEQLYLFQSINETEGCWWPEAIPRLSWYFPAHPAVGGRHRGTAPARARLPRDGVPCTAALPPPSSESLAPLNDP